MKNLLKSLLAVLLACAMLIPSVIVMADEEKMPVDFTDVKAGDWFAPYVDYCSKNGLVNGMSATTFQPNEALSRAMFVTILCRSMSAKPDEGAEMPFTDVSDGHWAKDAILWAYENEIVNGMTPTTFQPDAEITREQMCTILCRFADAVGYELTESVGGDLFTDSDDISEWAYESVHICAAAGIVNGITEDSFGPKQNATRAQACTILQRFIRYATTVFTVTEENGKTSYTYSDKYGVYATGYDKTDKNGNITESHYEEDGVWYTEKYTYNEIGIKKYSYTDSDGYSESLAYEYYDGGQYDKKIKNVTRKVGDFSSNICVESYVSDGIRIGQLLYTDSDGERILIQQACLKSYPVDALYMLDIYVGEGDERVHLEYCCENKPYVLDYFMCETADVTYTCRQINFNGPNSYPTAVGINIANERMALRIDYDNQTATLGSEDGIVEYDFEAAYLLVDSWMSLWNEYEIISVEDIMDGILFEQVLFSLKNH